VILGGRGPVPAGRFEFRNTSTPCRSCFTSRLLITPIRKATRSNLLLEEDGFDGGPPERGAEFRLSQTSSTRSRIYAGAESAATARCVLKFHHNEIGDSRTLPACARFLRDRSDDNSRLKSPLPTGQKPMSGQ